MLNIFANKIQKGKNMVKDIHGQVVARVWNLAKRLDYKTIRQEKKKQGFFRMGNKKHKHHYGQ